MIRMFTDLATCGSNLGVPFQEQEVTDRTKCYTYKRPLGIDVRSKSFGDGEER